MVEREKRRSPDIHKLTFQPPWMGRLRRAAMTRRRYPTSLSELSEQGNNPYEQILRSSADALKSHWRNNWREILAVGPFAQHRSLLTIPFIVYGDIRSVYPTLDAMSEALADTYSESCRTFLYLRKSLSKNCQLKTIGIGTSQSDFRSLSRPRWMSRKSIFRSLIDI